jgi:iron complex transport system ATP-binding protein
VRLSVEALRVRHGEREVVHGVSFAVETGQMVGIVGPNGSGKSTLLRGIGRLHKPASGRVLLGETDCASLSSREIARQLAVLSQSLDSGQDLTVEELVWRGRYPHQGVFQRATRPDYDAVEWAINAAELEDLRRRPVAQLSGGERQRAWIGMALAQQPKIMLLDEPTSFLDIRHQLDIMQLLQRLTSQGMTVVAVLHDLALAARFCERIIAIRDGSVAFDGAPVDVLVPRQLEAVFGVPMVVIADPVTGTPVPLPGAVANAIPAATGLDN